MCPFTFDELREKALELGWDDLGVTFARIPDADIEAYHRWVGKGHFADLDYMKKTMRCYPEELLPGAKTAILFVSYYKQEFAPYQKGKGVIASYARGRKYHNVHYRRLKKMIRWIEERAGKTGIAKGFSDSAPVLEKALASQAGLGWLGKNTLLIHRRFGTFTLLSGLFTTLELPYAKDATDKMRLPRCGSCTRCLDACPTQALTSAYELDARLCLSYHTIESKEAIPPEIQGKNPGCVFGCDICQDVCPHNTLKKPSSNPDFAPEAGMGAYLDLSTLESIEENPETLYGTPLQRQGPEGLRHTFDSLDV